MDPGPLGNKDVQGLTHPGNGDRGGVTGPQQHEGALLDDCGPVTVKADRGRVRGADGQSHPSWGLLKSQNEVEA